MEPQGSSQYTQEPATCPCPEPDQSSLRPPPNFSKIHFNIILPSTPGSSKNKYQGSYLVIKVAGA
jgi:hypothetical protein